MGSKNIVLFIEMQNYLNGTSAATFKQTEPHIKILISEIVISNIYILV